MTAVAVWWLRFGAFEARGFLGTDYQTFVVFGQRWLDTGSMYLPHQLAGPFEAQPLLDDPAALPSMYPPTAAYLFAAFTVLPGVLWWAIPLCVTGWAVVRHRPRPIAWLAIALLLAHPSSPSVVAAGGASMWIMAAVAAGTLWGWPAAFALIKPTLAWMALAGMRSPRRLALGVAAFALLSLPLAGEWIAYVSVVANSDAASGYLPVDPIALVPLAAWLGRSRPTVG